MHASSDPDDTHIPLTMPSGRTRALSVAGPEPVVIIHDEPVDEEVFSETPPPRWGTPHYIIAVSLIVLFVSVSLTLLRDRARDGELFRTAQAKRAQAAVIAQPATPKPSEVVPAPAPELAVIAEASARENAKGQRYEAQVALEIGDVVRAEKVASHAVENDPTEADGWLLLTAAQLMLNRVEASRASLKSCAEKATHGPRWECVALLNQN